MNGPAEKTLISRIKTLSPRQVAEVEDFVEFLAAKSRKRKALKRLLAIVPALESAGAAPMSEDDLADEMSIVREARRSGQSEPTAKDPGADRS